MSALTGADIDKLVEAIRERELAGGEMVQLAIPHGESRLLAQLHEVAEVYEQSEHGDATSSPPGCPRAPLPERARIGGVRARRGVTGGGRRRRPIRPARRRARPCDHESQARCDIAPVCPRQPAP